MNLREQAVQLRRQGYSYTYISAKTGLSKSTLSYHLRDIPYIPNKKTKEHIGEARARAMETKASKKRGSIATAREIARKDIGCITDRDIFMIGLGLYIGEGSKTQDIVRVVNTDYRVIKLFIRWLCRFGLTKKHFAIRIHLYPDSDVREAEQYWSLKTGLPAAQFQTACIDRRVGKDKKRNENHIHGTAHVTVRSCGEKDFGVALARRISAWMEEVLE